MSEVKGVPLLVVMALAGVCWYGGYLWGYGKGSEDSLNVLKGVKSPRDEYQQESRKIHFGIPRR